jgi:hypothetical protein
MRRKKDPQTQPVDPAKFWPVPGVDGEPYPPRVQEALDLVEKETKRLKIRECKHEGRFPSQVHPGWEGLHSRPYHVCACRDCGAERIACVPNQECDYSKRRTPNYGFSYERREARTDRMVSRQIKRASETIPVMLKLDHDPGTKPGAMERAMLRAMERDLQDRLRETHWTRSYQQGAMAQSITTHTVRNAKGEAQFTWTETDMD